MTTVLCQYSINNQQKSLLCSEFPQCRFIFAPRSDHDSLFPTHLRITEVFFGDDLTKLQLEQAPYLRWIQSPHPDLRKLPVHDIAKREDMIVTETQPSGAHQMGEYMMAVLLCSAKCLCEWHGKALEVKEDVWEPSIEEKIWGLKDKIFLQVGLGTIGTEMARRAQQYEMRVRAVHHNRSFNPHVDHILDESELHSLLPAADVVSISLPYAWRYHHSFGEREFSLMKKGALLIVTGAGGVVDEKALLSFLKEGKFRGVVLDAVENSPLSKKSPLWDSENVLITPGVSDYPKSASTLAFRTFRRNLRHYIPGNYLEMRGKVEIDLWAGTVSGRKTF